MLTLFTSITKYICLILAGLYTYCNFRYLSIPDKEDADPLCDWQYRIVLLLHFLMSAVLFFHDMKKETVFLYISELLYFLLYPMLCRHFYHNINRLLLNNTLIFLCYGLIMLERLGFSKSVKQFVIVILASVLTLPIPYLIDKIWDLVRWRFAFAVVGIGLLLSVLAIGVTSYGARMSISIGGFTFQASEIVKILFVLAMAGMLDQAHNFKDLCVTTVIAAVHVLVLVGCRDLGSALIFFLSYIFMVFIATNQKRYLVLGAAAAGMAAVFSYHFFSHVRTRVFAFIDPWADISDKGYQITQSLFAIGTGGFTGLGLCQGMPKKIPIVEKDFIISAISEELGAATAIAIILICLGCFMQMMMIGTYMESLFYKLIAVGLAIQYVTQVFLTIGGAIKFIPSTGVTLPFISYGGSSLIASFLVFAIIQAMFIIQGNEDEKELSALYQSREQEMDEPDSAQEGYSAEQVSESELFDDEE